MLRRPFPQVVGSMDKEDSAVAFIKEEHESFGDRDTGMADDGFESVTRDDSNRRYFAGDILAALLLRGRLQGAVYNVFMQLCDRGVCSLSALEHPLIWNQIPERGTCLAWIYRMLSLFNHMDPDWTDGEKVKWGISKHIRWVQYISPIQWLAAMVGRSFTSLSAVFDIVSSSAQLGKLDVARFQEMIKSHQPNPAWKADPDLMRAPKHYGCGTFASWLPENVDASILQEGHDRAAQYLGERFYARLRLAEMHYTKYFGVSKEESYADTQQGEQHVYYWRTEP
ncbi:hypothetical protein PVAG01_01238 [Phlyctema vagabunda]|uniref:Uncharacterized protein n=1 Tax=Phlyctema vagabunda TaxID=108571 RepID=A0ABR4PWJ8_9HELO